MSAAGSEVPSAANDAQHSSQAQSEQAGVAAAQSSVSDSNGQQQQQQQQQDENSASVSGSGHKQAQPHSMPEHSSSSSPSSSRVSQASARDSQRAAAAGVSSASQQGGEHKHSTAEQQQQQQQASSHTSTAESSQPELDGCDSCAHSSEGDLSGMSQAQVGQCVLLCFFCICCKINADTRGSMCWCALLAIARVLLQTLAAIFFHISHTLSHSHTGHSCSRAATYRARRTAAADGAAGGADVTLARGACAF